MVDRTYFVDALNGDDSKSGRRPGRAWRTLAAASERLSGESGFTLRLSASATHRDALKLREAGNAVVEPYLVHLDDWPIVQLQGEGNSVELTDCVNTAVRRISAASPTDTGDAVSIVRGYSVRAEEMLVGGYGSGGSNDGMQVAGTVGFHAISVRFVGDWANAALIWSEAKQTGQPTGASGIVYGCLFTGKAKDGALIHVQEGGQAAVVNNSFTGEFRERALRVGSIGDGAHLALVGNTHEPEDDELGLSVAPEVDTKRMHSIGNTWQSAYVKPAGTCKRSIPGSWAHYQQTMGWDL